MNTLSANRIPHLKNALLYLKLTEPTFLDVLDSHVAFILERDSDLKKLLYAIYEYRLTICQRKELECEILLNSN